MGCGKCHKHTTPLILTGYTNGCIKQCTRRCALYSFPLITSPKSVGLVEQGDDEITEILTRFIWNQEIYGCYPLGSITLSIRQSTGEGDLTVDEGNFTFSITAFDSNNDDIVFIDNVELTTYGIHTIPLEFNPSSNSVIIFRATLTIHEDDSDGLGVIFVDGLNLDFVGNISCSHHHH